MTLKCNILDWNSCTRPYWHLGFKDGRYKTTPSEYNPIKSLNCSNCRIIWKCPANNDLFCYCIFKLTETMVSYLTENLAMMFNIFNNATAKYHAYDNIALFEFWAIALNLRYNSLFIYRASLVLLFTVCFQFFIYSSAAMVVIFAFFAFQTFKSFTCTATRIHGFNSLFANLKSHDASSEMYISLETSVSIVCIYYLIYEDWQSTSSSEHRIES